MKEIKISSFPPGKDIKRFKNLKEERSKIINKTDLIRYLRVLR